MSVKKELVAKAGTYKNKEGEEKTRYVKVGVQMETAKGVMYKLEALPIAFDGWLFERDLQPKEVGHNPIKTKDEDVPF
jgi:macrodomain Ter protein organizer (MatP/YcbG family)